MGIRFLIDETKAKRYVVVAVACPDAALREARRTVQRLVLPGQRSIHMKLEAGRRRRVIADAVGGLSSAGVVATAVVVEGGGHEHELRARALGEIVRIAAQTGGGSLVLDLDPTQERRDRQILNEAVRGCDGISISFSHSRLASEPLLTLPDAVAWCFARGGEWRLRIKPVLGEVRKI